MNCRKVCAPSFSQTIGEQLLPIKRCCPFIAYMPNMPDKFGIKLWMLAEVNSKYLVNIIPYLGVQKTIKGWSFSRKCGNEDHRTNPKQRVQCIEGQFFISFEPAKKLQKEGTTIVGTARANSKHLLKEITGSLNGGKNGSKFYYEEHFQCMFVNYQCKEEVCIPSIKHACITFCFRWRKEETRYSIL